MSVKKNSNTRWIILRKVCQWFFLIGFIALFIGMRKGGWPVSLVNFSLNLDPLLLIVHFFSSRSVVGLSLVAIVVVVLTLIFGRVWCGWVCPLGTLLDVFSPHAKSNIGKRERANIRGLKYGLLFIILVAALLGNLTLLFLDPITILIRTLSVGIWPAVDQIIIAGEKIFYRIPLLSEPVTLFDTSIRPELFPTTPVYYRHTILLSSLFLLLIALNWVDRRFWCRYICPLGGLLGILSKLAIFRREVHHDCRGCALCVDSCPMGTINPAKNFSSDPSECTMCLDCLADCPIGRTSFLPGFHVAEWQDYDPGRRHALLAIAASISAVALFRSNIISLRDDSHRLQPPGGRENDLLGNCVRCGACLRACPTGGLQPSITEMGIEGLWTPVLVPRIGYCDFSCNACGQVCPTQAIPSLDLEEKRQQVIGKAYIDENRCLAWADHEECVVCEEMCPLPEKAITLDQVRVFSDRGDELIIPVPRVDRDLCIGCGICEFKCPVNGEAAIRVYTPPI